MLRSECPWAIGDEISRIESDIQLRWPNHIVTADYTLSDCTDGFCVFSATVKQRHGWRDSITGYGYDAADIMWDISNTIADYRANRKQQQQQCS